MKRAPLWRRLYVQVLAAILLGAILGVDRFMSECRSLTNFIGNAVAAIVVARWEGKLDRERLAASLSLARDVP